MQVFESLFLPINIKYFDLFMHQATIGHIHHVLHGGRVVGVLLIMSSIALVSYQVIMIDDVSSGLLVYVAQAFLLVASIFGLDYYVKLITKKINGKHQAQ